MGSEFEWFVFGAFVIAIAIFLAIGKWYPGSGAEQVDWRPTRSPEAEAQNEIDDLDQMLEAQNARRRATDRPELTETEIAARVREDEQWRRDLLARIDEEDG